MKNQLPVRAKREASRYEDISKLEGLWDIEDIITAVCEKFGCSRTQLFNRLRNEESVFRRGVLDLICTSNDWGVTYVAGITRRHHTTVINSLEAIERRLDDDRSARNVLREVVTYLNERGG